MRLSLSPKNEKFFDYFVAQAQVAGRAAEAMVALMADFTDVPVKVKAISDLEHEGDELVHTVAILLAKTFVTPIDREDIHQISSTLDDILDLMQGAATLLLLFKVQEPTPQARELAQCILESTHVILAGVKNLATFTDVSELKRQMKTLEKKGDQINREAIADLFDDTKPVLEVIKWKDIYQSLEDAIDKCEDIFDVLEEVTIKHA